MQWNVPPDALPGSATFNTILDRWPNVIRAVLCGARPSNSIRILVLQHGAVFKFSLITLACTCSTIQLYLFHIDIINY